MELVISANYTHVIVLEQGFENDFKLFAAKFKIQKLFLFYYPIVFSFKMLILIMYLLVTEPHLIYVNLNHLIVFL